MNLVYGLALHQFCVAQLIERPPGVWEVIGSIKGGLCILSMMHFAVVYYRIGFLLHHFKDRCIK